MVSLVESNSKISVLVISEWSFSLNAFCFFVSTFAIAHNAPDSMCVRGIDLLLYC